jgi:putative endonuclease
MKKWYVYLVKCQDDSLYCGITTDVERRVNEHNSDTKGAKYTKSRRPVRLEDYAIVNSRSEALKLEQFIKKCPKSIKTQGLRLFKELISS